MASVIPTGFRHILQIRPATDSMAGRRHPTLACRLPLPFMWSCHINYISFSQHLLCLSNLTQPAAGATGCPLYGMPVRSCYLTKFLHAHTCTCSTRAAPHVWVVGGGGGKIDFSGPFLCRDTHSACLHCLSSGTDWAGSWNFKLDARTHSWSGSTPSFLQPRSQHGRNATATCRRRKPA